MKFAIVVQGSPAASEAPFSALRFAESVVRNGHELVRVFFYNDGVLTANNLTAAPQDEKDVRELWQEFAAEHDIELIACIASCLRRGVLNADEADRYEKGSSNLADGFEISGLGQLIDASLNADRVVTFGA